MPLPLIPIILGIAAIGTGGYGIGKGIKAISDNSEANDVNERARNIIAKAKGKLTKARSATSKALSELGEKKLEIYKRPLSDFVSLFRQLKNVELTGSEGIDELAEFRIDQNSFPNLEKEVTLLVTSFAGGTVGGAIAGGAVAFGAYGAAGAFAAASTGTAIASLSGAAATNATLAFFGSGSLAAGGLGIAGGTMVLGGLVAGPALAVLGAVMGAKASENLDNAYSNLATANKTEEEIETLVSACNGIKKRADLFRTQLCMLGMLLTPMLLDLEKVIRNEGTNYQALKSGSKKMIAALVATVQATKAMIDTPILNKDGKLTNKSHQIAEAVQKQIKEKNIESFVNERYYTSTT